MTTVADFPKKEKIITISNDDKLPDAFKKIFENHIQSALVLDAEGHVKGAISVIDILLFCINVCQTSQDLIAALNLPIDDSSKFINFDPITNYLRNDPALVELFSSDQASFITNYSKKDSLPVVAPSFTMKQLVSLLTTKRRVVVCDGATVVNYITQTDTLKFLNEKKLLGDCASKTVEELHLAAKKVETIKHSDLVVEAFKKMIVENISGVGVVNAEEKLIGCVSASDIKGIKGSGELLDTIFQSYDGYRTSMSKADIPTKAHVIKTTAQTTLQEVVDLLLKEKIHRVFITDKDDHVTGVISFADILRCVDQNLQ